MRDIKNEVLEGEPVDVCKRENLERVVRKRCYKFMEGRKNTTLLGSLKEFHKGDSVQKKLGRTLPTQEEIDYFLGNMPIDDNHLHTLAEFFGISWE